MMNKESGMWKWMRTEESQETKPAPKEETSGNWIGIAALIVGTIFVVLAGAMFATTTWRVIPNPGKVMIVFALAAVFFLCSEAAVRVLHIDRTANACYLLGCIFLFLTVLAAGYFELLGPVLAGEGRWWKILSVGNLLMVGAMICGVKRFANRLYTMACLWGISITIGLTIKALGGTGAEFVNGMSVYASLLTMLWLFGKDREMPVSGLLSHKSTGHFVMIHFAVFSFFMMAQAGSSYLCWMFGQELLFGHIGWNVFCMVMLAAAAALLAWKENRWLEKLLFQLAAVELIHYGVLAFVKHVDGHLGVELLFFLSALLTAIAFFVLRRLVPQIRCTAGDLVETLVLFNDTVMLAVFSLLLFHEIFVQLALICLLILLACVMGEWGKRAKAVRMLIPVVLWYLVVPAAILLEEQVLAAMAMDSVRFGTLLGWMTAGYVSVMMLWDALKKDVFAQALGWITALAILLESGQGHQGMVTVWLVIAACYIRYIGRDLYCRQTETVSVLLLTAAFFNQPWIVWPDMVRTEITVFAIAAALFRFGRIWDDGSAVRRLQTLGYVFCLAVLGIDAMLTGALADALILEGICLVIFLAAHIAGSRRWVKISGAFLIAVAFYMTKDFWLSIAWWIYLLAAGIGLIVFAAVREKNRKKK